MPLGDFVYRPDATDLRDVLGKFNIPEDEEATFSLVRFECISPDAFIWRLGIDDHIYYLYAEDFVEGLDDVRSKFESYLKSDKFKLIPVLKEHILSFDEASPVKSVVVYQPPEDAGEMMQFAVTSGFHFVFLAKSSEDGRESLFSAHAPRGFVG